MVDGDVDTGFSRPLEGSQTLQRLPVREADDPIIAFQDEPFMGFSEPGDARGHLAYGRDFDFPTDCRVLDVGAVNLNAGRRILWGRRTHQADARLHAPILPPFRHRAKVCPGQPISKLDDGPGSRATS